jgi:hypothetical protein
MLRNIFFVTSIVFLLATGGSSPSNAQMTKQRMIENVAMLSLHHNRCNRVWPKEDMKAAEMFDQTDLIIAWMNEENRMRSIGKAKWCALIENMSPSMQKYPRKDTNDAH